MRFLGFAVVMGAAIVLGACGKGDTAAADSAAPAVDTAAAAPAAAPMAGVMAPITGTTHEVKMIGDAQGYRFEPAEITAKAGDGVRFVFVSQGPHNVAFDPTTVPAEFKAVMMANMPEQQGELAGKMLLTAGESYTISLGGVAPGTYEFNCTPHLAMNMKGKIIVQ